MQIKAQAAVDFLMSYGIALIIILIAVSVIYKVSVTTPVLANPTCATVPGFACEAFALNRSGVLTMQLSQATGGTIIIRGVACSSTPNSIGNNPAYGNVWVTNQLSVSGQNFYTTGNAPLNGITVYSGESNTMFFYCYQSLGIAAGRLGNGFTGYVWLNYTIPNYGNITEQVATLSLRYV